MASSWKRDFASGLVILLPVLVVAYVVFWLYNNLTRIPIPIDSPPLRVALTLVVFVLLVFAIGYMMRTAAGSIFESVLDDLMNHLPGLRVVYNASKMAVDTALSGTDELQTPVKLEVWGGLRMTAFKTGKTTTDGRDVLFLPTAPNITTGFVIEVDPSRYVEADERVEDALTRILSAGFGDADEMGRSVAELVEESDAGDAAPGDGPDDSEAPAET
ncbi:MAG: DUF502 domain-containing protein [Haloarculaceae archaeon]